MASLAEVGLVTPGSQTNFDRRIEFTNKKDSAIIIFCFSLAIIGVVVLSFIGPPYIISIEKVIPLSGFDSAKRVFKTDISNVYNLNKFVILELFFSRENTSTIEFVNFSYSLHATSYSHSKHVDEYVTPGMKQMLVTFPINSNHSEVLRVLTTKEANFDHLKLITNLEFNDEEPRTTYFKVFTGDSAFTILSYILRSVLFVISLVSFINFKSHKIQLHNASISNQFIYILLLFSTFATCPYSIINYYVENSFFSVIDAFITQSFLILTCYCGFVHLMYHDLKNETPSKALLISYGIPFMAGSVLLYINTFYSIVKIANDPVVHKTNIWSLLFYTQFVLIILFIILILTIDIIKCNKFNFDQMFHTCMALSFATVVSFLQITTPRETFISSNYAMQIYATATTSIYVLFFAYLNWPVLPINQLEMVDEPGQSLALDTLETNFDNNLQDIDGE